jgi:hypothetical protein
MNSRVTITPDQFSKWLGDIKEAELAKTEAEIATLLGISHNALVTMKKRGGDLRTAFACNAILRGITPYE